MSQSSLVQLAKQGNVKVIAALMNRLLKPQGMVAEINRQNDRLEILIESETGEQRIPNQQALVTTIRKWLTTLEIQSVSQVTVFWQKAGQVAPTWAETFDLDLFRDTSGSESAPNIDTQIAIESFTDTFVDTSDPTREMEVEGFADTSESSKLETTGGVFSFLPTPEVSKTTISSVETTDRTDSTDTGDAHRLEPLSFTTSHTPDHPIARDSISDHDKFALDDLKLKSMSNQDFPPPNETLPFDYAAADAEFDPPPINQLISTTEVTQLTESKPARSMFRLLIDYILFCLISSAAIIGIHYLFASISPSQTNPQTSDRQSGEELRMSGTSHHSSSI